MPSCHFSWLPRWIGRCRASYPREMARNAGTNASYEEAPELMQAMLELEQNVRASGLPTSLVQLVKTRASQLNGCAYCVHMHSRDARAAGESEERLYLLSTWRESPLYSALERAALGWTEALTLLADTHAPDDCYAELAREFSESERVKLTM